MPDRFDPTVSRRNLLLGGSAAGLLGIAGFAGGSQPSTPVVRPPRGGRSGRAKNIIMLVSDGMSMGTLTLGDYFLREQGSGSGSGSAWLKLLNDPAVRTGLCSTGSANGPVTDSAASATAWSVGSKANNGAIGVLPDGSEPMPMLIRAKQAGKAVGVVTTTRVTHATPAAFYANTPDRNREDIIAAQMFERELDVVLGGGARYGRPHFDDARAKGYEVVEDRDALLAADPSKRIIGLFKNGHMPYVLDREAKHPSLPEMSRAALDRLDRGPNGFVLQIEAGRVDHAAHANDAASLVADQIEFERTIELVRRWAAGRDDTLVIVTTDHGNANPGCAFYGQSGIDKLATLASVRHSFGFFFDELERQAEADGMTPEIIGAVARQSFAVELSEAEIDVLKRRLVGNERVDPFGPANNELAVLGSVLANHVGVSFMSVHHTSDHVLASAFGPGSEALPGFHDNTELYGVMVEALGLSVSRGR